MGQNTNVSWCDHSFNPWWGCIRMSPGCEHCYAEAFAKRVGQAVWGPAQTTPRRLFGPKHWQEPLAWNKAACLAGVRRRVFCASMADVFEDHPDVVQAREQLWATILATRWLNWQLLTKRPENIRRLVPPTWLEDWPAYVWIGTTVEDQQRAEERIPHLLEVPAPIRFLSCEPLLERVDLSAWLRWTWGRLIHWVIIGGESGPHYRPMALEWAERLRMQCEDAGTAVWFKQASGRLPGKGTDALGREYHEFPQTAVLA